eukprot:15453494-Alexandrium_andersonii.AAC.1
MRRGSARAAILPRASPRPSTTATWRRSLQTLRRPARPSCMRGKPQPDDEASAVGPFNLLGSPETVETPIGPTTPQQIPHGPPQHEHGESATAFRSWGPQCFRPPIRLSGPTQGQCQAAQVAVLAPPDTSPMRSMWKHGLQHLKRFAAQSKTTTFYACAMHSRVQLHPIGDRLAGSASDPLPALPAGLAAALQDLPVAAGQGEHSDAE